jgi:AhpC/TSA family
MTERQQVSLNRDNYRLSWPDFILEERMAALQAGEMAPEIELPAVTGKQRHKFKLSDLRGKKNVIVAFYPLDWSPT